MNAHGTCHPEPQRRISHSARVTPSVVFLPSAAPFDTLRTWPRRRSGAAVLDCFGVRFFRARRGKTEHMRMGSTMLPFVLSAVEGQAESAPNAGDRVTEEVLCHPQSPMSPACWLVTRRIRRR